MDLTLEKVASLVSTREENVILSTNLSVQS